MLAAAHRSARRPRSLPAAPARAPSRGLSQPPAPLTRVPALPSGVGRPGRAVFVAGSGLVPVTRKAGADLATMGAAAIRAALADAGVAAPRVGALYVGNMMSGILSSQQQARVPPGQAHAGRHAAQQRHQDPAKVVVGEGGRRRGRGGCARGKRSRG